MRVTWLILSLLLAFAAPLAAQTTDLNDLRARAETGDVEALLALAQAFHEGAGVTQNYAQAALWAEQAANQGDATAQNLLGRYAYEGLGAERNQQAAVAWLRAAADQGDPQHIYDLGVALEQGADGSSDPEAAARAYEAAAALGHLDALVSLGTMAQTGSGMAQDYDRARTLFEQAANQGHARAQNNLGLLYVRGSGVEQDYERAASLFTAAAEQGLKPAMRNLGVMYANAFGVPLDEARAADLYRAAGGSSETEGASAQNNAGADLIYDARLQPLPEDMVELEQQAASGDPVAQFQLGWGLMNSPAPSHEDMARAATLFAAAARAGHAPAMVNLGVMYFQGRGVAQDYVLGQMWLTRAAGSGLPEARNALNYHADLPTPAQINQAQELARRTQMQQ
ncbi:MAG: SEL1-like repeat protein [Sulfitobacter sp.]